DPAEFIGDSDRGFVVASSPLNDQRPLMKPRQRLLSGPAMMRGPEHRAGTVREQTAKVHVAAFADSPESPVQAAGILARRQSQPARKLARAAKRVNVPHGANQRRGGQEPDPGNLT